MQYYIRPSLEGAIAGPYSLDWIRERVADGMFPPDSYILEAVGQSEAALRAANWQPISSVMNVSAGPGKLSSLQAPASYFAVSGRRAAQTLKWFAFLYLLAAVVTGLNLIGPLARPPVPDYEFIRRTDPVGVAIVVGVILHGVFGCAVLYGFASIVENVAGIREHFLRRVRPWRPAA